MRTIKISLLAIINLVFFLSVNAQIMLHRNIRVEDGLVQSTVRSICQDSKGYIWFGTDSGLSRWDGIDFKNYQLNDGLIQLYINKIILLPDSSILVSTHIGLSRFKDGNFYNTYLEPQEGYVFDMAVVNSEIWLGTSHGIYRYENNKIAKINLNQKINESKITAIHQGPNGVIYLGLDREGAFLLKEEKLYSSRLNVPMADAMITEITTSSDGKLFVATEKGLFIDDHGKIQNLNKNNGLSNTQISALVEGNDGTIYIASKGSGITLLTHDGFEYMHNENGLGDEHVLSLYKGNDGTIYIGTRAAGVFLYRNRQFITYNESVGLINNFIMSITEDAQGNMYFGSGSDGISILSGKKFSYLTSKNGLITNSSAYMKSTRDNKIFITNELGAVIYDPLKKSVIKRLMYGAELGGKPRCFYENKDGEIFIGMEGGLAIYKNGKVDNLRNDPRGIKKSIVSVDELSDGTLSLATMFDGIAQFRNGKYQWINESNGLINDRIITTLLSKNGDLYVGTIQGLSIINEKGIRNYDNKNGLSDNTIYGIIEDNDGKIYVTTNRGINVLDFDNPGQWNRIIRSVDGIASDELNGQACFKDSKGRLWFGTVKGVTCYDPSRDIPHSIPPQMHITRARLLENDIDIFQCCNSTFSYDENYFRFDFIGINISSPKSVNYKYRMKGLEEDWLQTKQNSVQYTNLNDGQYTFEVMAENEWGYWSEAAAFPFVINPPFWETIWFVSVSVILFIGIVVYLVTYRFRQLLAFERLRTKIAADLHDNIGSSLTEISIMGEVIVQNVKDENPFIKNGLKNITDTSRLLVDKMSDIVWLVNPKRDSLYDLILRLKDSYSELLSYRGISFKAHNLKSLENISLNMEHRQNLYLIFKEGINNSIKHSSCDEINIEAQVRGKSLEMILRDNGIGLSDEKISGNGLENMRVRAKLIGGELKVESSLGQGTKIQFLGNIA